MTTTPRTDAHFTGGKFAPSEHDQKVPALFARKLEQELAEAIRQRDYHKEHEQLNCNEAVWFEEALGFKEMPLGINAHELAKEKVRDMICELAELTALCEWRKIHSAPKNGKFQIWIPETDAAWPAYTDGNLIYSNAHGPVNQSELRHSPMATHWKPFPPRP